MRVVALTGTVAAGKSTVATLFRERGATIIDADAIVRELQQRGTPTYQQIVACFGPGIVADNGSLDRSALRTIVLRDPDARRKLEAIVHPAVEARRQQLLHEADARGDALVVVDIPLLFESADPSVYDQIIVVDAPVDERRRRMTAARGLSETDAGRLIAAQLPAAVKRARATWVIENDADRATLADRAEQVWKAISH